MASRVIAPRLLVLLGLVVAPASPGHPGEAAATAAGRSAAPATAQALPRYLEAAMADWRVPGVAIAVVKDDQVVLLHGAGVREAGRAAPVDGDTLFPIASLSKGFTAALAALEVAGGRLAWDRRVVEMLPGFRVADPWVTRELSLDDLLTHRTGWQPEVDHLWAAGLNREAILERLVEVKQGDGFRAAYSYLNVPYLVAGEAIARASGGAFTTLLRERLFEPLGMSSTRTSMAELGAVSNRVAPHSDLEGAPRPVALEDGDAVAPAAGLHSTAADMARWMRFQLGDGSFDGRRLLSAAELADMHEPRTLIPRGAGFRRLYPSSHFQAYARGWVVQDYRGRAVVWNTGGLLGAACSLALVPEEKLGVVVLTNGPRISFPESIVFRALDAWLGAPPRDWSGERLEASLAGRARAVAAVKARAAKADPTAAPRLPLASYAGGYRSPLLGELALKLDSGALRVALGAVSGSATHWRNDAFLVTWDNPFHGTSLLSFALDAEARPLSVELEEFGSFERVPTP